MSLFKRKPLLSDAAGDHLAKKIADRIVLWQQSLSSKLNRSVNRYSKQRQKWFLVIFCMVSSIALTLCQLFPFGTMAIKMSGHNYQPSHIGLPSGMPIKSRPVKTTASLTTKK